jgi:hypothetical protein
MFTKKFGKYIMNVKTTDRRYEIFSLLHLISSFINATNYQLIKEVYVVLARSS